MEFKNDQDVAIAEKMLNFPMLGDEVAGKWNIAFTAEIPHD